MRSEDPDSPDRRSELIDDYQQFTTSIAETRAVFDLLISDLQDIQKYLDRDLTSSGIQALKPSIDAAFTHGATAKQRLNGLIQEAYQLDADLYPGTRS